MATYRTIFVGILRQESFLNVGGSDDPYTTVDSPFCRDGRNRPTLRGTGLAGALIATLRRLKGTVPIKISGTHDDRQPSVWHFFNSHPVRNSKMAYRQHVAIDPRTGAAATSALFNVETLPPGTGWPFLLEVDTFRDPESASLARQALLHWCAGRCLLGKEVARGLGWMRLENLREYTLATEQIDLWPCAQETDRYPAYLEETFSDLGVSVEETTTDPLGWVEITGSIEVGVRSNEYGIDSLSIGGHASEELLATWDEHFLSSDIMTESAFDPDFMIVTFEQQDEHGKVSRLPYIPGSTLRGPLRHALARLLKTNGKDLVDRLFGTIEHSAKLLISDAFPDKSKDAPEIKLAWFQHHAEDEFTASTYGSAKFDRVAVIQGRFLWKMVLEKTTEEERAALKQVLALAERGQVGIGGGQWRGHGWMPWKINHWVET